MPSYDPRMLMVLAVLMISMMALGEYMGHVATKQDKITLLSRL